MHARRAVAPAPCLPMGPGIADVERHSSVGAGLARHGAVSSADPMVRAPGATPLTAFGTEQAVTQSARLRSGVSKVSCGAWGHQVGCQRRIRQEGTHVARPMSDNQRDDLVLRRSGIARSFQNRSVCRTVPTRRRSRAALVPPSCRARAIHVLLMRRSRHHGRSALALPHSAGCGRFLFFCHLLPDFD